MLFWKECTAFMHSSMCRNRFYSLQVNCYAHVQSRNKIIISSPEPNGSQGELIVYQWSVVRLSSSIVHTFKLEYLWSQLVNLDQILCVASLGCIRFWDRLDQNSGFHGNRKPPLTYNGENDITIFSRLFLIRSFLYLQVMMTCIKSWTS